MLCQGCNRKFNILRRRKHCEDCTGIFCVDCVVRKTNFECRKHQCYRCKVFTSVPLDRSAVAHLKIKDLRWYLDSKSISIVGCKEKTELVDLIMQNCNYGASQSSYPQNNTRHTAIPELFTYENKENVASSSSLGASQVPGSSMFDENFTSLTFENSQKPPSPASKNSQDSSQSTINNASSPSEVPISLSTTTIDDPNSTIRDEDSQSTIWLNSSENSNPYSEGSTSQASSQPNTNEYFNSVNYAAEVIVLSSDTEDSMPNIPVASTSHAADVDTEISDKNESEPSTSKSHIKLESLKSLDDINALSVLQLKLLLTKNYVAYKGCCEKYELQEKVKWLWNEKETEKNAESISDENICKVCMVAMINSVFLDCGHMVTCKECGKVLSHCPVCRQSIVRMVHIFRA